MSKLWKKFKLMKESKHGNRFYSSLDIAEIKHQIAVRNSQVNRGEIPNHGNEYISVCGCGCEGCFVHGSFESIPQEKYNEFVRNKKHHKNK